MKNIYNHQWSKKFFIMWSGQGISLFTNSVIQMVLAWYLIDTTGSAAILMFATLISYLPQVLLGPFIGVFIDRYNRKMIMIGSDLFIILISLSIVFSSFNDSIPIWLILTVLGLRSICAAFHTPSLLSVTPLFVPKDQLTRYAGYSQGVESVSTLLSPMAAAALYSVIKLDLILLLDVLGALLAIITLFFISTPKILPKSAASTNILAEAQAGITIIYQEKGLIGLLLISTLYGVIYLPIGTLFPLICIEYFNGGFVSSGIVETIFSIGMLLGAMILGAIGNRIRKISAITFSIVLYGIALCITGLLPPNGLLYFTMLSFFMGVSIPFYSGVRLSIFQAKVDAEYLGRVLSLSTSIQSIAMPLGLILAGLFVEKIGVEKWFLISGILTLLIAIVSKITPSIQHCCDEY